MPLALDFSRYEDMKETLAELAEIEYLKKQAVEELSYETPEMKQCINERYPNRGGLEKLSKIVKSDMTEFEKENPEVMDEYRRLSNPKSLYIALGDFVFTALAGSASLIFYNRRSRKKERLELEEIR